MDFEFYVEDDHAVVKRYNGKNTDVIIPKQYNGFPVTHIAVGCFYKSNITTIVGKSIKSIDYAAFKFCKGLTSINLPVCTSIYNDAFMSCKSLTEINLPSCESVGIGAFRNCTSLTSISLPDCSYISYNAFNSCTNLTYVNLPACEYVGAEAFDGCTSLIKHGKYKATEIDLTCRDFQYEIGKWFEEDEAILCRKGFHYVENFYDIFNYYCGKLGEDLRIFEVDADKISYEREIDSKRVCKKIKLVNEIKSYSEMFDIK